MRPPSPSAPARRRRSDCRGFVEGQVLDDTGRPLAGESLAPVLDASHLAPLAPLDDVRGTGRYRLDAARTLVTRALDQVQERLQ